jgi:hypothetical protein
MMIVATCMALLFLWGYSRMPGRIVRISIRGARLVSRSEVARMVDVAPGAVIGNAEVRRIEMALARNPAFCGVSVSRGVTGTLHVSVREREPVAWLISHQCAVARDGTLLPHLSRRDDAWVSVNGFAVADGKAVGSDAVMEAVSALSLARELGVAGAGASGAGASGAGASGAGPGLGAAGSGGFWRRLSLDGGAWEWKTGDKLIHLNSPINKEEFRRLQRFTRAFPDAWARARLLDLRFAERVVVRR